MTVQSFEGMAESSTRASGILFSTNMVLAQVVAWHDPGPLPPSNQLWPASVTVKPLAMYTRRLQHKSELWPGEVPASTDGLTMTKGYEQVTHVPVVFPGTPSQTATEVLPVGTVGLLFLLGKHHGSTFSDGIPVPPQYPPNPWRLSDSVFMPCALIGSLIATMAPEAQPRAGVLGQLGPRTLEAATTYLRKIAGGWALGGSILKMGSDLATRGAARLDDVVSFHATVVTFFAQVAAALTTLGIATSPPASPTGKVSTASTVVLIT